MRSKFTSMNRLLIFCTCTLGLVFANIEMAKAQRFTGKIIAGLNGSQIDGDQVSGYYRGGLLAGFGASFQINDKLSIGPEFLFSGKGSQVTLDQVEKGIYSSPRKIKLNYVDVPIIVTYNARPGFRILGGLSVNYLLKAEIDLVTNVEPYDARNLFSDFDYNILLGLEYEVFDNVWLQGRWSYSIIEINKQGTNQPAYQLLQAQRTGGFYNNLLQFSLRFDLKRGEKTE